MTKSVEDQVAHMLAEIQAHHPDPLEASNNHTPTADTPEENAQTAVEDTEPVHVFFVRESEVQQALLDAKTVEAETPTTPQPVTSRKTVTRNNMVLSVGIFTICVLISILLLFLFIVPQLVTPSATITVIPVERSITTTQTIKVDGRVLPALTLSQSQTTPATGNRHQNATQAQGTITFYNGQLAAVTIAAGNILTGDDGVQVITDQPAVIPAANLPYVGQVTVPAHALDTGRQGNIQAYDINQACCVTAVKAVNTTAFTGGAAARDYVVVTKSDLASAAAGIISTLEKSERAALEAQVNPGESLIPPLCSEKIIADHKPGDEAREVHVTVSETCIGIAYSAHDVYQNATQIETSEALNRLGTGYSLVGDMQVSITHATITNQARGIATMVVKLDAIYVYQLSPGEKQQLVHLVAGKTRQQAQAILFQLPGIAGAAITIKGNAATLPEDPGSITILVVQRV